METQLRPALGNRNPEKASRTLKTMWQMVATGLLSAIPTGRFGGWYGLTTPDRSHNLLGRLPHLEPGQCVLWHRYPLAEAGRPPLGGGAGRPRVVAFDDRAR